MEESGFNVESGLESGALASAGTSSSLVLPHTIKKLREDDIPDNNVPPLPAPAPAPAPEPRPIPDMENNDNPRAPGDQHVMTHDELWECYPNYQSSYAPSPNENPPEDDDDLTEEEDLLDDDDDDLTEEGEEKTVPSKRRRTGEHDQKLTGKAALEAEESSEHPDPIEKQYTNEMLEGKRPKLYVSTCSPPESISTDGSEALDITTPAVEPLFIVSTDSKAEGVGEKQAQGACEEQAQGIDEEQARDGGEER